MTSAAPGKDDYRRAAGLYDLAARLYSGGRIERSKRVCLDYLAPGRRVLFAGAGTGADVLAAAATGARIVAAEKSPAMRERLRRRLARAGPELAGRVRIVEAVEAVAVDTNGQGFDLVCAHYFLNVFAPEQMRGALRRLSSYLRPGGRLIIADFAPAGRGARACLQNSYFYAALFTFRILAPNALHPIYNYADELRAIGLHPLKTIDFPLAGGLLRGYRVWIAEASSSPSVPWNI